MGKIHPGHEQIKNALHSGALHHDAVPPVLVTFSESHCCTVHTSSGNPDKTIQNTLPRKDSNIISMMLN